MPAVSPVIKIIAVAMVSLSIGYVHYLLFRVDDFATQLRESEFLLISVLLYAAVILFFAQHYYQQKQYLILAVWLFFNLAISGNFLTYFLGYWPPLALQYSQSSSLLIYTVLLAFTKDHFPNWQRIFSGSCLLILIPCLVFYFAELWLYYEITIYLLCLTPILNAFVFLKQLTPHNQDILDN